VLKRPVVAFDRDTRVPLGYFESIATAAGRLNLQNIAILNVCQLRYKSHKDVGWRWAKSEEVKAGLVVNGISDEDMRQRMTRKAPARVLTDKPVMVLDKDTRAVLRFYESAQQAATSLNVSTSSILGVCQMRYKACKGLGWRYALADEVEGGQVTNAVSEEELRDTMEERGGRPASISSMVDKAVVVVDKDSGALLRYYASLKDAASQLGISRSGILDACQRRTKACRGLGWRYVKVGEAENGRMEASEEVPEAELKRRMQRHAYSSSNADKSVVVMDVVTRVPLRYYDTVNEAAIKLGVSNCGILNVCRQRHVSCKGLAWRYAREDEQEKGRVENEVSEEELKRRMEEYVPVYKAASPASLVEKPVVVLDKETGVALRYYESVTSAAARLIVQKHDILNVCRNKFKSTRGYGWRYAHPVEVLRGCVEDEVSEDELRRRTLQQCPAHNALHADKPVVVMDMYSGEVLRYYRSAKIAAKPLSISPNSIVNVCQHTQQSHRGLVWRYASPEEIKQGPVVEMVSEQDLKLRVLNYVPLNTPMPAPSLSDKPVVMLDKETGVALRFYETVKEAANWVGAKTATNITNVCRQTYKSCKGFGWRYALQEEVDQGQVANEVSNDELRRILGEYAQQRSKGKGRK
jgi:hypothetical protein